MKLSTRIRYGVRAMIEIAMVQGDEGVLQKDISERQNISNKYLDHIITALKVAHLIKNTKGKKSGYLLARPASDISMLDIHNAFEPGIVMVDCDNCDNAGVCAGQLFWCQLNVKINDHFKQTSLQQMVHQQKLLDGKKELIS